jgi:hypothetical protein
VLDGYPMIRQVRRTWEHAPLDPAQDRLEWQCLLYSRSGNLRFPTQAS